MVLDFLPSRSDSASANMATDLLLLQRYPEEQRARFRHYGWHRPAFTFGFSQKVEWVRKAVADVQPVELCRRPTGGGLVDHRDDWTYAFVLPRAHPACSLRAVESYAAVHRALTLALRAVGGQAEVKTRCDEGGGSAGCETSGICFRRAELYDVVHPVTDEKIAGAAQKRSKRGLLFQGSVWRPAAGALNWDQLPEALVSALAQELQVEPQEQGWPEWDEEQNALTESYASAEWNEQR